MVNFSLLNKGQKLVAELSEHDTAYYVRGQPTITDAEYDLKLRELQEIEKTIGPLPGSPTQRVGSDLDGAFAKVKHAAAMLSLANVFSADETQAFFGEDCRDEIVVEAKIDGAAVELRYENGLFIQAVTRGDGSTGDDVSANVRTLRCIPLKLPDKIDLRVRGEIYLRRSDFEKLNAERLKAGEEPMANPRNAAAGTLKQKSPAEVAKRNLSFLAYAASLPADFTQQELTAELYRLGFCTMLTAPLTPRALFSENAGEETTTPLIFQATLGDPQSLSSAIENIRIQRDDLDLEIDGAVIKINSRARQAELGNKTKVVAWGCAYKFPAERVATELLNIEITIGRTGQATPNGRLKPVQLSGTTVSNCSLMNADELVRQGNPGIGDIVWIEKSAEIIPRLVGVKERRAKAPWAFSGGCPYCGIALVKREDGVHYFDNNPACPERVFQQLKHATAKGALDWDGMGEAQIRQIIATGQEIRQRGLKLSDLFTLDPEQLGLKTAALKKFHVERERVKAAPLWRKLCALGVEHVGQTLSKELAAKYGSLDKIVDAMIEYREAFGSKGTKPVPTNSIRDLMGPVALDSLFDYLQAESEEICTITEAGFLFEDLGRDNLPLAGQVFCITGTLVSGTRDQLIDRIEAKGGLVKSSVGRKTTALIAGENPGGNKTEDAQKYGIQTIDEARLYELLGEEMPRLQLPDLDAI